MDDIVKKGGAAELPACVVVANSIFLEEWQFLVLDDILESAVGGAQVPVVILGAADARETPRSLLLPPACKYLEQDHVLPVSSFVTGKDAPPVGILMSGLSRAAMQSIIYGLKQWDSPEQGKFPKMAFAMVVENALDTSFSMLFEQIINDWRENEG